MFNLRQLAALVVTTAVGASAFAAGYEKNIMWSGRHAGPAGTGAAWTAGGEALYFNPAGIVTKAGDRSITGNLSLVTSQFEAPTVTANQAVKAEREYYGVPAFFYAASPTDKFGYAVGMYAAGGSRAHFGNLNLTSVDPNYAGFTPTLKSEIEAVELSVGAGYEVMNDLKVGAAYRLGRVKASFSSISATVGSASVLNVDNLEGYQQGFRTGVQYQPEGKHFGVGASYRSALHFSVTGDASGSGVFGTAAGPFAGTPFAITSAGKTTVKTIFPEQLTVGGYFDVVPEAWRAHVEYVFTEYSRNQALVVDGTVTTPAGTGDPADLVTAWRDQHNVRVAGEYLKSDYPIRFGYVWSSGVENPNFARAIFAAPGKAHTFTIGTGRGNERWDFDVAAEYIMTEADASPANSATVNIGSRPGHYETSAYALHTGVTYKF